MAIVANIVDAATKLFSSLVPSAQMNACPVTTAVCDLDLVKPQMPMINLFAQLVRLPLQTTLDCT